MLPYLIYAGGITAIADDSVEISNCCNTGNITAESDSDSASVDVFAGGITGMGGDIRVCYNTGDIYAHGSSNHPSDTPSDEERLSGAGASYFSFAGGISGYSGNNVRDCYNRGTVTAYGKSSSAAARLSVYSGGIIGATSNFDNIQNCYNAGDVGYKVEGDNSFVRHAGYIIGNLIPNCVIANCYWSQGCTWNGKSYNADDVVFNGIGNAIRMSGQPYVVPYPPHSAADLIDDPTVSLPVSDMTKSSSFAGFDFENVWGFIDGENDGYPILRAFFPDIANQSLYISMVNTAENGGWVEIHNPAKRAVSARGLFLSNDSGNPYLWQIPCVIVQAGETVRVNADSNNTDGVWKRMQSNFDAADGETVRLSDGAGNTVSLYEID